MRYIYLILFITLTTSSCTTSCNHVGGKRITGNGNVSSEQRSISGFTGIEVAGPYDVQLEQGPEYAVRIEGDENLLKLIDIHLEGDALSISSKKGYNLKPKSGIRVYITAPKIDNFGVAGSGSIKSASKIRNTSKINIEIGGSGDVILDLDAPQVLAEIGGSGSVTLRGTTRNFEAEVAGSGEVHAFELLSENSNIEIAGSGDAELFASKTLNISIAGSGDVRYKGTPAVKQSIAGSGDIRQVQ